MEGEEKELEQLFLRESEEDLEIDIDELTERLSSNLMELEVVREVVFSSFHRSISL